MSELCRKCDGHGQYWVFNPSETGEVSVDCEVCLGSGREGVRTNVNPRERIQRSIDAMKAAIRALEEYKRD